MLTAVLATLVAELGLIGQFIVDNFLAIWPFLLLTIPLAVAVNLSGASRYINRAFQAQPVVAIFLATAVGAFSPFCSCSVIPVVAALLLGGVPLAPVMAFWIASPSMDPEIFFLSAGLLGWELAAWRLGGTLVLSLAAGLITHFLVGRGWLGERLLRDGHTTAVRSTRRLVAAGWRRVRVQAALLLARPAMATAAAAPALVIALPVTAVTPPPATSNTCAGDACTVSPPPFWQRLRRETTAATLMVLKFMALAFFLEALIILYVPQSLILGWLGQQNQWAVVAAALLGVPVYTSNLTALPLVGGLLGQGMDPGAALAFLIAGPTTTLPAMAAVWGLVRRRVFLLYVLLSLAGAVALGSVYGLLAA